AEAVMSQGSPEVRVPQTVCTAHSGIAVQRKCTACAEEDEEQMLQRKESSPSRAPDADPIVEQALKSPGQPLDDSTRSFMESRLGEDFGNVRVHTDVQAAVSAKAVNALAYTVGNNIVIAAGQYNPQSTDGRRLVAHELVHVVQQGRGGFAPSPF